jgi:hypothetical protein
MTKRDVLCDIIITITNVIFPAIAVGDVYVTCKSYINILFS